MYQQETDLYRHYDSAKTLLYVGISLNAAQRLYQHMRDSRWSSEISSIEVERFPNRYEALAAEERAIKEEKPLWNVVHNRERKKEKGAAKGAPKETTQKSAQPKKPKALRTLNLESLEQAIDYTISKISMLGRISEVVWCEEDASASTFVKIKIKLPWHIHDEDLGLDEFMTSASFKPHPRAYVSMMTGYTLISQRCGQKNSEITLMTPNWLREMLYRDFNIDTRETKETIANMELALRKYEKEFFSFVAQEQIEKTSKVA